MTREANAKLSRKQSTMTSKTTAHPAHNPFHALIFGVVACTGIALAISGPSAFAVEQCRFIQAKIERETCYQRQEAELAARRKRPEEPRRDKMMESLEQMKHEDEALKSKKPDVMRLVGTEGNYGEELGLTRDWAVRIIRRVGNYGEVYDRNVGSESKLKIPRGLNQLWNAGGIQYAPPIR